jgi:TonB family protein
LTRAEQLFPWLVLGSLAVHAAVTALLLLAPGGSGSHANKVEVYSVQIIEAPAPPTARALQLEAPINRPELVGSPPSPLAPPKAVPLPPAAPGTRAPRLPAPVPSNSGDAQVSLKAPSLPDAPAGSASVTLPSLPSDTPMTKAPSATRAAPKPTPGSDDTTPDTAAPARPIDRLRNKVEQLKLQVEPQASQKPGITETEQDSGVGLRLFFNTVRERVQKNYSFPGTFPKTLKARVRVVVARDGTQLSAQIIQPSGDDRFDNLVCLAAIRNSRLPRVPETVEGETVTVTLSCSP